MPILFRAFRDDIASAGQEFKPTPNVLTRLPSARVARLLEACKPLADFVRVSNTNHSTLTGDMPGTGLLALGSLYQPKVDLELYMERIVLHQNLTGLNVSRVDHTSNHVVTTLALAMEALKEFRLQGACETVRAPITTVGDTFGESNTRRLPALCQVGDTGDLPPVYQAWTDKKKNDRVQHMLQDHLDSCAAALDTEALFVTTTALKLF